jgi:hypothetical protein
MTVSAPGLYAKKKMFCSFMESNTFHANRSKSQRKLFLMQEKCHYSALMRVAVVVFKCYVYCENSLLTHNEIL